MIPDKEEVKAALPFIDYRKVSLEGNQLSFQQPGMGIDLGGIAKGFIADDLKGRASGGRLYIWAAMCSVLAERVRQKHFGLASSSRLQKEMR